MDTDRLPYQIAYRLHWSPWDTGIPTPEVVAAAADHGSPGRALDLGCGTGTNAIYLARQGWQVTGVDIVQPAVARAHRKADRAGTGIRLIHGDATRLDTLDIGTGYRLIVDVGCYHTLPLARRGGYAAGVTRVAAAGATLVMIGVGGDHLRGPGITADQLRERFPGWRLEDAAELTPDDMRARGWPRWLRLVMTHSSRRGWRFRLRRDPVEGKTP